MTAAIGHSFYNPSMANTTAGKTAAQDGDASAFGALLNDPGKPAQRPPAERAHDTKAGRSADHAAREEAVTADKARDGRNAARLSHPDDRSATTTHNRRHGRSRDEDDRDQKQAAAQTPDGTPLRDRMPLLTTLQELSQRQAGETSPKADGNAPATQGAATAGAAKVETGEPSAVALTTGKHGGREPSPASDAKATLAAANSPFASQTVHTTPRGRQTDAAAAMRAAAVTAADTGQTPKAGTTATAAAVFPGHPAQGVTPSKDETEKTAGIRPKNNDAHPAAARSGTTVPALPSGDAALHVNGDAAGGVEPPKALGRRGRDTAPDRDASPRASADHQAAGPAAVVSDRSFPAPAAHPVNPTTAGVIDALAVAGKQASTNPVLQYPQPITVAHPAQVLRIELHPAELGSVVASLRLSGEQLSVELKPQTAEAYRRLSGDSEEITKSLKKLGLDVDTITVMQPSIATPPAARTDAGNQAQFMAGRDASQFQSGSSGSGDNFGGQQSGRNRGHDGQPLDRPAPAHRERPGGALFI
jgi:chemotaxis protein MotD